MKTNLSPESPQSDGIKLYAMSPDNKLLSLGNVLSKSTINIAKDDFDTESNDYSTAVNVTNTYSFECKINPDNSFYEFIEKECKPLKDAQKITDRLNDLVEEFHAPGTPRRERRTIKREFDRLFNLFQKHCKKHNIQYTFQKI